MRLNKVLSLLLTIALMLNTICVVTAFAEDAQITISGAVTEVQIGTAEGRIPAIGSTLTGFIQNPKSLTTSIGDSKADFTVYSPVEAVYKLSLCYGGVENNGSNINLNIYAKNGITSDFVTNEQQLGTETIKATGKDDSMTWVTLGAGSSLKLSQGVNTIRFERTNSGASFKLHGFKLETVSADNSVEIGTGAKTISTSTNCSTSSRNRIEMRENGEFSIPVYAIDKGNYKLYVDNENGVATTMSYKVGEGDYTDTSVAAATDYQYLGIVSLEADTNTITLKNNGTSSYRIRRIKLEYTNEKIYATNEMSGSSKEFVFRREVSNADGTDTIGQSDTGLGETDGCNLNKQSVSVFAGKKLEYNVIAEYDGNYKVYLNTNNASPDTKVKVWVDTIDNTSDYVLDNTNISAGENELGTIPLKAGKNKITFENTGSNQANMTGLKLECIGKTKAIEFTTGKNRIEPESSLSQANRGNVRLTAKYPTLVYKVVNGDGAGAFKVSALYNTAAKITLYENENATDSVTLNSATDVWAELGIINLAQGTNTLKLQLEETDSWIDVKMLKFEAVDVEPVVVASEWTGRNVKTEADIYIKKYADTDDVLWLVTARYCKDANGTRRLKGSMITEVNFDDVPLYKSTLIRSEAVANYKDTEYGVVVGEDVQVFLLNSKDLTPLTDSYKHTYTQAEYNQAHGIE